jgi:hypothetical protein
MKFLILQFVLVLGSSIAWSQSTLDGAATILEHHVLTQKYEDVDKFLQGVDKNGMSISQFKLKVRKVVDPYTNTPNTWAFNFGTSTWLICTLSMGLPTAIPTSGISLLATGTFCMAAGAGAGGVVQYAGQKYIQFKSYDRIEYRRHLETLSYTELVEEKTDLLSKIRKSAEQIKLLKN